MPGSSECRPVTSETSRLPRSFPGDGSHSSIGRAPSSQVTVAANGQEKPLISRKIPENHADPVITRIFYRLERDPVKKVRTDRITRRRSAFNFTESRVCGRPASRDASPANLLPTFPEVPVGSEGSTYRLGGCFIYKRSLFLEVFLILFILNIIRSASIPYWG